MHLCRQSLSTGACYKTGRHCTGAHYVNIVIESTLGQRRRWSGSCERGGSTRDGCHGSIVVCVIVPRNCQSRFKSAVGVESTGFGVYIRHVQSREVKSRCGLKMRWFSPPLYAKSQLLPHGHLIIKLREWRYNMLQKDKNGWFNFKRRFEMGFAYFPLC